MEFTKRDLKSNNRKTVLYLLPFFVAFVVALYVGVDRLNTEYGYNISKELSLTITVTVLLLEYTLLAVALMRNDVKVVIEGSQLEYYVKMFGKYKLSKQIAIDEISYIRTRFVAASRDNSTELYYVIDKKGKKRFLLQQINNKEEELLADEQGCTLVDYLQTNYGLRVGGELSALKEELEMLKGLGIGLCIVVGFIFLLITVAKLLA